ncbi:hypothetical protein BY458DRAFT_497553 [Sporodiniella umbellata]|nr:hypothetical protein BY458DRAFT_497553 [Sporodiniella umbellata]
MSSFSSEKKQSKENKEKITFVGTFSNSYGRKETKDHKAIKLAERQISELKKKIEEEQETLRSRCQRKAIVKGLVDIESLRRFLSNKSNKPLGNKKNSLELQERCIETIKKSKENKQKTIQNKMQLKQLMGKGTQAVRYLIERTQSISTIQNSAIRLIDIGYRHSK